MSNDQFANNPEDRDLAGAFGTARTFNKNGVGLALSGGGYKAVAFHLGGLIRLNQIGWLPKLCRVTGVSAGSIAVAHLARRWNKLDFSGPGGVAGNFDEVITRPLHQFVTTANIGILAGFLGFITLRGGGVFLADAFARLLLGEATLQDLPAPGDGPEFVFLATNYELNTLWRFSRAYAADHRVGMIKDPRFTLARVVAASSASPPFDSPLKLDLRSQPPQWVDGADRNAGRYLKRALLTDGGVFDNMGLEPIWMDYGTLLVSNAGDPIPETPLPGNWFTQVLRIIGMIHRQAENDRQRVLMAMAKTHERTVAYWPLRNPNDNYPRPSPVIPSAADIAAAQQAPVKLSVLSETAFAQLANHGYSLCDSATRSYLPLPSPAPASALPFP
jgi:NTE family protein